MEEEDELCLLDYRTPKGKLIKLLEQKIKKPEIDDSLGKVLDQFSQLTNEQTAFLDNGIFHMNFAEDALLLQSCGQFYAKRVDKLWDELLQFHTRMVKYDEKTSKNCTDSNKREARKQELARLEERLNRGKRKKVVLTEPETNVPPTNGCYVFDIDQDGCSELFNNLSFPLPEDGEVEVEEQPVAPFEHNFEIFDEWRAIRRIDEEEKRRNGNSDLVAQYHRLRYRFKHYNTPGAQEMIYDFSDPEEFNTREGRLISFHHIKHLFEYNDKCLLPDEDFTVAKLRIAYVLKKKWLLKNKVDPDAPYETYKEAWEKYQKDFFDNEKRKIQNMPQSNSEELMKFYKALARKEQIAIQKVEKLRAMGVKNLPIISFENVIVAPVKEGYEGIFDPYIPEDFDTPQQVLDISEESVPNPTEGDHEAELSTLLGDISKLPDPSSQTLEKPRSDSGYFDGEFEADDDSDHEDHCEGAVAGSDTPFEFDKENAENKEDATTETRSEIRTDAENINTETEQDSAVLEHIEAPGPENTESETTNPLDVSAIEESVEPQDGSSIVLESPVDDTLEPEHINSETSALSRDDMNRTIREFVKQATSDEHLLYKVLENSYFYQTDDMVTIVYDKPDQYGSHDKSTHADQIMVYGYFYKSDELVANRQGLKKFENPIEFECKVQQRKKRKLVESLQDNPPPKRRKLSQKQVQMLKRSLIAPVNVQKWDKFFSLNYQPEAGEGEVNRVEYEPDSDEDLFDDMETNDADHPKESEDHIDIDVSGYHSEHDGSYVDDHIDSAPLPLTQDSGIDVDISLNETEDDPQKNHDSSEPQQDKAAETERSENDVGDLCSIDLLGDLSKNTGISREELAREQLEKETPKLTPYEQERENVRSRVAEWKEHIMPKLKKLDEHDFDIHEYGTNILNRMTINEPKPFSALVGGKSSAEVVRYFISSLQLANTLNVEICGAKKGELSNDTFKLKLLNTERYHEHFQEYQAPSEETLMDRLKKVKEIRMQNKAQKQQCTNVKTSNDEEYRPQSILKRRKSSTITSNSPCNSQNKRIKILKYNIGAPSNRKSLEQPNTLRSRQDFDFQQPSTSWQADILEQQNDFESAITEVAQTPARSSVDSGFMPSCDEDFLEQFDQLQQISGGHLQSTPVKPHKILKISLVRINNSN